MLTRLGLHGGPRKPYGIFSGKSATKEFVAVFTRHGLHAGPRKPYGSFDGKEQDVDIVLTRLGLYGGARTPYGSFVGKEPAAPDEAVTSSGGQFFGVPTREAVDRRNLELYGIPIPDRIKHITLKQSDGSFKSYDIVRDREIIEQFNIPLSPERIARLKKDLLTVDGITTVQSLDMLGELDDEEAIVLLMMQM